MSEQTDPEFLSQEQYRDESGLTVRNNIQERYRTHPQSWFDWVFDHLQLPSQAYIIDVGAGPGDLWEKNADRLPPGWRVILADLSAGMIQAAQRRLNQTPTRCACLVADAQALPFPTATQKPARLEFDALLALGLMDHLPNPTQALTEAHRILRSGGQLYTSGGSHTHLQEIERLVRPFMPEADYGGDPDRFGLENGAWMQAPWFTQVEVFRYTDELVFHQAEPILAYTLSEAAVRDVLKGETLEAFRRSIDQELKQSGEIRVTTEKALFRAIKE